MISESLTWRKHQNDTDKKYATIHNIFTVFMPNVLFSFLLLVLYLAINTAGQIKHLQTFQKLVLLPLLRSGRSKDLSKICYAETCVWLFFVYEKVHLRWYKFFLTVPSGKGQKEFSFQGSSSYLPENKKSHLLELPLSLYRISVLRTFILNVCVIFERKTKREKKNPFKSSSVQLLT